MDTTAFSLTVPPVALKMPNGLHGISLSPPGARVPLHYLETDLEDPFAFNEEDDDLKKGATVRKLQSKLAQKRQRQRETEILEVRQEHFSPRPAPSHQQPPPQLSPLSPLAASLKPPAPPPPQGVVCKAPPPPSTSLPMQGAAPTTHTAAQARPLPPGHPAGPPPRRRPDCPGPQEGHSLLSTLLLHKSPAQTGETVHPETAVGH
ncbi:INO80 complex subunit D-like [Phoca vitulina]|uniref:INO80 complex subunit D-like n=1 Tax=Phoca vitulina TaxID=9720 RepID=UPI0013965BB6|nr:INO80 complex subunit D-like [Phoca vitulina]